MGRPSSYEPDYAEQVYKLCLLGATDAQIADFFEVSEVTINAWKQQFPEFLKSLKAGKKEADAVIAQSLFHRAKGYSHPAVKIMQYEGCVVTEDYTEHFPPDTTACIFWLKNRQPELWRDAHKVEHEHKGKVRHDHVGLSETDKLIESVSGEKAGAFKEPLPH